MLLPLGPLWPVASRIRRKVSPLSSPFLKQYIDVTLATLSKTSGAARQRRKKEREALAAAKKQPGILSTTSGAARRRRQRKREAVAAAVGKSKQGTASRSSPANGGLAPGDEASGSAAQASPKGPEAEDGEWMDETSDDPAEKEGKKEKKGRYSVGEDKGSKGKCLLASSASPDNLLMMN